MLKWSGVNTETASRDSKYSLNNALVTVNGSWVYFDLFRAHVEDCENWYLKVPATWNSFVDRNIHALCL